MSCFFILLCIFLIFLVDEYTQMHYIALHEQKVPPTHLGSTYIQKDMMWGLAWQIFLSQESWTWICYENPPFILLLCSFFFWLRQNRGDDMTV